MGFRILVFGAGKSGTSALYDRLHRSAHDFYGVRFGGLFEPRTREAIDQFDAEFGVAKLLLERWFRQPDHSFVESYDKRVLIVRDPRDNVVSRLMWNMAMRVDNAGAERSRGLQQLLAAKQENPKSVSTLELFAEMEASLGSHVSAATAKSIAYLPASIVPALRFTKHTLLYEDFMAGNLQSLSDYMGFPVSAENTVSPKRGHIKRSTQTGSWRDWMLPVDQEFFFDDALLASLGYEATRYDGPRSIAAEESTLYVERLKPVREQNMAAYPGGF